jgi:ribosomal protein S18 acetylase RimI-like enzyme
VVLHALRGPRGRAIRERLRGEGRPVVVAPAGATGGALLDGVRAAFAGARARKVRFRLTARSGAVVRIRAIRPSDRFRLRRFDAGLSERSRSLRYLGFMPPMTEQSAAGLAAPDFAQRFAFVAVAGRRVVGDCRLVPATDRGVEMAIAVSDDWQGSGLGPALLETALRTAAERGITEVIAEVRYDNQRMSRILRRYGFERTGWELGIMTFTWTPSSWPAALQTGSCRTDAGGTPGMSNSATSTSDGATDRRKGQPSLHPEPRTMSAQR